METWSKEGFPFILHGFKYLKIILFFMAPTKNVPLEDDVYDALHSILNRERTFQGWPKKSDAKNWKSGAWKLKDVRDPMVGGTSKRTYTRHPIPAWLKSRKSQKL